MEEENSLDSIDQDMQALRNMLDDLDMQLPSTITIDEVNAMHDSIQKILNRLSNLKRESIIKLFDQLVIIMQEKHDDNPPVQ